MQRSLLTVLASLVISVAAFGQTTPARPTAEETAKIERALEQCHQVVLGKLEAIPGLPVGEAISMRVSKTAWSGDGTGSSSFPLQTSAKGPLPGSEGVWFVTRKDDKFHLYADMPSLPSADFDKVLVVTGSWLARKIDAQIKKVAELHQQDPDGDKDVTWKAIRELYTLGENEMYFPLWRDKTADHPSRGHLADAFKALGMDLGFSPYPKTAEERLRAIEMMKRCPEGMVRNNVARPNMTEENFNFALNYFLFEHFSAMRECIAADDVRFKSEARDWQPRMPTGVKITRMGLFQAKIAALTSYSPPATRP